ncbi:metallophosphoesterase family protein [Macrococcoides caseolyticum]|uniref:metallophosphoesterase family protein n=1 Tax=Macrococcoides caseolyticum TaxID=69966 RepID=UPI001F176848|nr:DNA repair exonuclease [Macrococcus caseolyticus]MCE4957663.1 DNA repair exonuclease [Macrococcus caseolyticus]
MIKFIHCSDLFLDEPFDLYSQLPEHIMQDVYRASFESFKHLVNDAIEMKVDFILISGNLFSQHNRNIRADKLIEAQFERLNKAHIFVYYIAGTSDGLSQPSYIKFPDNVVLFSEEVQSYELITNNGHRVFIHGFSYKDNETYEYKLDNYPINQVDHSIHIGMLHGIHHRINGYKATEFSLEDLNTKLYHYWALGHYPYQKRLSDIPEIHYPGKMQGTSIHDTGHKGYLYVEGDHAALDVKFIPTAHIQFDTVELTLNETGKHAIYQDITDFKNKVRHAGKSIYHLKLINPFETLIDERMIQSLLKQVQMYESNESEFVWIDKIELYQQHEIHTLESEFSSEHLENEALFEAACTPIRHSSVERYSNPMHFKDHLSILNHGESRLKLLMRDES